MKKDPRETIPTPPPNPLQAFLPGVHYLSGGVQFAPHDPKGLKC